jgi:hypothetical protein
MNAMGLQPQSNFPPDHYERFRDRFVGGHGGYPLIGTPDQVADELERVSGAGLDAVAFGFLDYRRMPCAGRSGGGGGGGGAWGAPGPVPLTRGLAGVCTVRSVGRD